MKKAVEMNHVKTVFNSDHKYNDYLHKFPYEFRVERRDDRIRKTEVWSYLLYKPNC